MTHGRDDTRVGKDETRGADDQPAGAEHELPEPHQGLHAFMSSALPAPHSIWVPWRPSGPPL